MAVIDANPGFRRACSACKVAATLTLTFLTCALMALPIRSAESPVQASIDFSQARAQWDTIDYRKAPAVLDQWQTMLNHVQPMDIEGKLRQVNRFVHDALTYRLDSALWQREDYWASPLETLAHGMGDCEDYVIIQYVSLLNAGITDDQLRLIYVRARIGGPASPVTRPHMVLGYYPTPGAEPLILDSLIEDILPASERTDLTPVFSFNSSELWAGGGGASAGSSTARLSPWRDVLNRMEREGVSFHVAR